MKTSNTKCNARCKFSSVNYIDHIPIDVVWIIYYDPRKVQFAYLRYRCHIYMVSRLHFVVPKRGHPEMVHDVISNLSHTLIPFTHNTCYVLSYVLLCPLTTLRVYKNTEILSRFSFCFDFSSWRLSYLA